ncbi:MAG: ABC transporter permease [Polyangiales bacterium]
MISASLLIAGKDLTLLLRDRMALFWVVAFPLGFALFFGSVMKAGVDAESAPLSIVLVLDSSQPEAAAIARELERSGLQTRRGTRAQAVTAVRLGEAVAFVRIRDDQASPIELGVDPSRRSESALLLGVVKTALAPDAQAQLPRIDTTEVMRADSGSHSGYEIVLPAMLMWGLLGCAATFAVSLVSERSSGTLLRLRAAPISRASILGGKSLACAIACMIDVLLLSLLARLAFDVRIEDPAKYLATLFACTVCFTGLTMVLCTLGKTEQAVSGAGWATLIVFAMIGGAMVPLSVMPSWLLELSNVSPVKWGIWALEGATWRDLAWHELLRPLALLVAFGVTCFVAGLSILIAWREL